ncbi:hypothetical protein AKJ60_00205 [candidate division MSBL1 archaeon SCGC-AAA385M11]|nr:hypothetical protein AKJ60_00205 [candidate division MSBL1 archaeon SCGC-AAA385M11]
MARQPIFRKDMSIWGYELLFRRSQSCLAAKFEDAEIATSQVITHGLTVARAGMAPMAQVMINFSEKMILGDAPFALSGGHVVELLEDVAPSQEVLEKCLELKEKYLLAIDDYQGGSLSQALLDLTDIVKVDVLNMGHKEVKDTVARLKGYQGLLLAEKVENHAMFQVTKNMGFDLFQGFFFSKPVTVSGKKLESNELAKLELMRELEKAEFEPQAFSRIIQRDVAISYCLLSSINSPGVGLLHRIQSISHAVRLLGERRVRQWVRVLVMADIATSRKDRELMQLSAAWGYFLSELSLNYSAPLEEDSMFLLGLFSLLHVILSQSMEQSLSLLPLDPAIENTLLGEQTEARQWLDLIIAYERGDWDTVDQLMHALALDPALVAISYNNALANSSFFLPESSDSN